MTLRMAGQNVMACISIPIDISLSYLDINQFVASVIKSFPLVVVVETN